MPRLLLRTLLSLACALGAMQAAAQALPRGITKIISVEGITEYRLANGLQILLAPDASKPTTTVNLTYRVGSRHENYGETGMAHLLEHLLFKGSKKNPQVWNEFTQRGLAANGSTWFDRTNYYASFAANDANLRWYLGWQADAMVNSFIAKRDLDTEMTVVRNEMEMGENSPERILFEKTLATMYQWHNYGKSTIGARTDVENVSIPRLQAFYRQYYQPDNAALIVTGKFDPAQVLQWALQDFGKLPRPQRSLARQYTLDPIQDGERSVTLRRRGGVPLVNAAYHVPAAAHPDYPAIELLQPIMADAPSGRLHQQLVDTRLAASSYGFAQGLFEPGFTLFGVQLTPEQDVAVAQAALQKTLESVATTPLTQAEFERAQRKWLNSWEQNYANAQTVGVSLSESVAQGDWRLFFLQRDRIKQLKLADVQRVAQQYFLPSNRTAGVYIPTEQAQRAPAPTPTDVASAVASFVPQSASPAVAAFDASPANIDRLTQRSRIGGLQVALLPKPARGQSVHATLALHFGNEHTLKNLSDIPDLTAALLEKGTSSLSREQIQDRLDALQTELSVKSSSSGVTLHMASRQAYFIDALNLVAQLLKQPSLSDETLVEIKNQAMASLAQQRKEPQALADNLLDRLGNPYPRDDVRYARNFDEQAQDLAAVTRAQIADFHRRFYSARHAEFSAVGDIDVTAVQAALQRHFADWQSGEPYTRIPEPLIAIPAQRLIEHTPDKQNAVLLARLSVPLQDSDPDYPALTMANHLLGAGGSSRLWKRIRETEGLSYDVRTGIAWNTQEPHSQWQASAIFAPQNRAKVEAAFSDEIRRTLQNGYTAAELTQAKQGLLALRKLSRAQDANLATGLANNLHLGRSYAISQRVDDALAKLSLAQVNAALRRYVKPDAWVVVWAGDFKTSEKPQAP
jgi:zinc protease